MKKLLPLNNYLIAYNGSLKKFHWLRLVSALPRTTLSKRVIKSLFRVIFFLSFDRVLSLIIKSSELSEVFVYFDSYEGYIVFSSDLNERYRFYLLARSEDAYLFIKVIRGGRMEPVLFEEQIISRFVDYIGDVHIVSHQHAEVVGDFLVLEYKMLPEGAYRIEGNGLYEKYFRAVRNSRNAQFFCKDKLQDLDWFSNFLRLFGTTYFKNHLMSLLNDYVELGLAHGDLGSENIYCYDNSIWIIDWEKACDIAPVMTDYIGLNLSKYLACIKNAGDVNETSLRNMFDSVYSDDFSYVDFLLGIAFYGGTNFKPFVGIIQNFHNDET